MAPSRLGWGVSGGRRGGRLRLEGEAAPPGPPAEGLGRARRRGCPSGAELRQHPGERVCVLRGEKAGTPRQPAGGRRWGGPDFPCPVAPFSPQRSGGSLGAGLPGVPACSQAAPRRPLRRVGRPLGGLATVRRPVGVRASCPHGRSPRRRRGR